MSSVIDGIKGDLERASEQIADAKTRASEATGSIKMVLKMLHEQYGIETLEEAEEFLKTAKEEIETEEASINESFKKLKEKHDWI